MTNEIWKEFMRWTPDNYPETTEAIVMVSNLGRVKRLHYRRWNKKNNGYSNMAEYYYVPNNNRGKQRTEKEDRKDKFGKYLNVNVNGKTFSIHRLVALCFVPNPYNKEQVNHIDSNRSNNHYLNLEWVTNYENLKHARENGSFDEAVEASRVFKDEEFESVLNIYFKVLSINKTGEAYGCSGEAVRMFFIRIVGKDKWEEIHRFIKLYYKYEEWKIGRVGIIKEKKKYVVKRGNFRIGSFYSLDEAIFVKENFIKEADNEFFKNSIRFKKELIEEYRRRTNT